MFMKVHKSSSNYIMITFIDKIQMIDVNHKVSKIIMKKYMVYIFKII